MVGVHPEVLDSKLVSARRCERQSVTCGMIYLDLALVYSFRHISVQIGSKIQLASKRRALRVLSNKIQQSTVGGNRYNRIGQDFKFSYIARGCIYILWMCRSLHHFLQQDIQYNINVQYIKCIINISTMHT